MNDPEVLGRKGTSSLEETCFALVRHRCSPITVFGFFFFSKDLILALTKPWHWYEPFLFYTSPLQFCFLWYYIWKDFSIWTLLYAKGYDERRLGFMLIGIYCLGNFNLQTKGITFQNAVFSLPYPVELFVSAKYLGLDCNSPWITTINFYCKVRLPYF